MRIAPFCISPLQQRDHAGAQYPVWAVQGSIFFLSGVGLVVWGWAIIGMIVETYGFWCLFAGFIPTALSFLRRIPVFGRILDLPVFKKVQISSGPRPADASNCISYCCMASIVVPGLIPPSFAPPQAAMVCTVLTWTIMSSVRQSPKLKNSGLCCAGTEYNSTSPDSPHMRWQALAVGTPGQQNRTHTWLRTGAPLGKLGQAAGSSQATFKAVGKGFDGRLSERQWSCLVYHHKLTSSSRSSEQ